MATRDGMKRKEEEEEEEKEDEEAKDEKDGLYSRRPWQFFPLPANVEMTEKTIKKAAASALSDRKYRRPSPRVPEGETGVVGAEVDLSRFRMAADPRIPLPEQPDEDDDDDDDGSK